jgi:hypothetical protein
MGRALVASVSYAAHFMQFPHDVYVKIKHQSCTGGDNDNYEA